MNTNVIKDIYIEIWGMVLTSKSDFIFCLFSRQLVCLCELYNTNDITRYLVPIAVNLASDKVSEVRHIAFRLVR